MKNIDILVRRHSATFMQLAIRPLGSRRLKRWQNLLRASITAGVLLLSACGDTNDNDGTQQVAPPTDTNSSIGTDNTDTNASESDNASTPITDTDGDEQTDNSTVVPINSGTQSDEDSPTNGDSQTEAGSLNGAAQNGNDVDNNADNNLSTGDPLILQPLPQPPLTRAPGATDEPIPVTGPFSTVSEYFLVRDPGEKLPEDTSAALTEADYAEGMQPAVISTPENVDPSVNRSTLL